MNQKSLGNYLLDTLFEKGVKEIFSVPGDYVLQFDKLIEEHPIRFINCVSELNLGYMANAYACLRGLGVACITYGVGISIINAVAQAYVESMPLVLISGAPGLNEYSQGQLLHHLFNKPDTSGRREHVQLDILKAITVDQVVLGDLTNAAQSIERALNRCQKEMKPIYIELPRDQIFQVITPFENDGKPSEPIDDTVLKKCVEAISDRLKNAQRPVIWAGHEMQRFGLVKELIRFAEKHQIPIASSLLGRTVVSERHPLFIGIYEGKVSRPEVQEIVENSDCLLQLGVLLTDVETGLFTADLPKEVISLSASGKMKIDNQEYQLSLEQLMKELNELDVGKHFSGTFTKKKLPKVEFTAEKDKKIRTARIFECLKAHIGKEHFVVTDFGDSLFGSLELILEQNSFMASSYFAAIGFGSPAAVGVQFAVPDRRIVGIVGDGAFQVSSAELSTAVRYGLDPVIIVLNNHGYGTERPIIEGSYNDILDWNYSVLPQLFGGGKGIRVTTEDSFEEALCTALVQRGTLYIIEVPVDKLDFSPTFERFTNIIRSKMAQSNRASYFCTVPK